MRKGATEILLERPATTIEGVVIGMLVGLDDAGRPLVDFAGNPVGGPTPVTHSIVAPRREDARRQVALLFQEGDPHRPVLVGVVQIPTSARLPSPNGLSPAAAELLQVVRDGESLVVEAKKDIVLRCGKASITLTRAGKVLLRGSYLLSHASGTNRIRGGSVQIN